jgi:DnaK suppressor protein
MAETVMKIADTEFGRLQETVERKEAELVRALGRRDGITIEKSADQMDEIQYAKERDLAIRNVDRDSVLLRQVRASLRRIHDGRFGTCQDAAGRHGRERTESASEPFVVAA